jgi:hypothetical protein
LKENITKGCGNGVIEHPNGIELGFPLNVSINLDGVSYPSKIESYGDLDAQIWWIDVSESSNSLDLKNTFFDGDTDSLGAARTLDADVEAATNVFNNDMIVLSGSKAVSFGADDGTTDLDAYTISSKDGALNSQVNTGIDIEFCSTSDNSQSLAAVVDTGGDNDIIWLFAVDDADPDDIYYATSEDDGESWDNQTLWLDEAGTVGGACSIRAMSAAFDEDTCDIMVVWQTNASSPWLWRSAVINSGTCPSGDTCDYSSGTWEVDCTEECTIDADTDVGGENILFDGVGLITVTHNVTNWAVARIQGGCVVRQEGNGGLKQ